VGKYICPPPFGEYMERQIMIATLEHDPHADRVIERFLQRGVETFRLHMANSDTSLSLKAYINNDKTEVELEEINNGYNFNSSRARSIWWRRSSESLYKSIDSSSIPYARRETKTLYDGIWSIMDTYWMSEPSVMRNADNKPEQLFRAKRLGFSIPRTLISNRKNHIIEFMDQNSSVEYIYKSATSAIFYPKAEELDKDIKVAEVTIITPDVIDQIGDFEPIPLIIQEVIPKRYELRVTVIGKSVFFAKINSQDAEVSCLDWRKARENIKMESYLPSPKLKALCLELTHSYGLNYSAIDLIVTPEGEIVFLEINPGGQFIFVEILIPEFKMIDKLCDCLQFGFNVD